MLWEGFLGEVWPHAASCPVHIVENAIRNAVIEFCEKAEVYRVDLTPINLVAGQASYPLTPADGYRVQTVIKVLASDKPLTETTVDILDTRWPRLDQVVLFTDLSLSDDPATPWREFTQTDPALYFMEGPSTVRLVGIPDTAITAGLKVNAALVPTFASTGIDDSFGNRYREKVAAGALYRLMLMPDRPWTNPKLAGVYMQAFNDTIDDEKGRVARGHIRTDRSTLRTRAIFK